MCRNFAPLSFLLCVALTPAQASTRWGGLIDLESAVALNDGRAQHATLTVRPQFEWRSDYGFDFKAVGRLRADAFDRLEPGEPDQQAIDPWTRRGLIGDRSEAELREFYVDVYLGDVYLRAGKQQIVWGEADGLKALDVVNPQSFRTFILDDFEDSRIPLWSIKLELPLVGPWSGQFLLVTDQTYNDIPEQGAVFAITSPELAPQPPPGVPLQLRDAQTPNRWVADADAGVQLSAYLDGWDVTINYLYHYDDNPAVFIDLTPDGIVATPEYTRTHTAGGTLSNAFGDFTLRAELGYSTDRRFIAADPTAQRGVVRAGDLSYVLGMDWMGLRDTLLSMQVFQSRANLERGAAIRDSVETDLSVLAQRTAFNDTLTAEFLAIHDVDRGDGLISPSIRYDYLSNLEVFAELDMFYGEQAGRFGQFDRQDRLLLGLTYGY